MWLLATLTVLALMIHPYMMVMAGAVLGAVLLTLLIRNDGWRSWMPSLTAGMVAAVTIVLTGHVFGYWGVGEVGGYGVYSMNLASPVWPAASTLFPKISGAAADATGGQYEGYQYLGGGLLFLLVSIPVTWRGRRLIAQLPRRHGGLALMAVALVLMAMSNRVYLFHSEVLHIPFTPPGAGQLRGSGRLFWPVTYIVMLGGIYGIARAMPRAWPLMLTISIGLQWIDSSALRGARRQLSA